jgi:hypothetical protein
MMEIFDSVHYKYDGTFDGVICKYDRNIDSEKL